MSQLDRPTDELLEVLRERAKELSCLYRVEEQLKDPDRPLESVLRGVVEAIPAGWQYPEICRARITHAELVCESVGFQESPWRQEEDILVQDRPVGTLAVFYTAPMPDAAEGPFLEEERRLIRTIADRLGHFILHQDLREAFQQCAASSGRSGQEPEWKTALSLLRKTDREMYQTIARKLLHHMCWRGVKEARALLESRGVARGTEAHARELGEANVPLKRTGGPIHSPEEVFEIAAGNFSPNEILSKIHKWIHEDKSSFLLKTLIDDHSSLPEIADAMARYQRLMPDGLTLTSSAENNVVVSLIRRLFTDQLDFVRQSKAVLKPEDFFPLLERVVYTPGSHGRLGGKSAGLFLALHVLRRHSAETPELESVKAPKTWHLASDGLLEFIRYNDLEDVLDQKYKDIDRVRQEYEYIVRVFKSSRFPPEIIRGLSVALDDLADSPLVVRSSSLLEDRGGTSFPGKYKSLFLANTGTKQRRLEALLDAIAEVYASTFGPDPIEYRAARGLLDFDEQMGVMIQEVVGTRVGKYFLPLCAGVAFSKNDFRWSPRLERDDGMVRLVPGLGTRAVDRVRDDYPVLVAPGKPLLRVNPSPEEVIRYAPRCLDLINVESGEFETVEIGGFLREHASLVPNLKQMVSVLADGYPQEPIGAPWALADKELIVTFDGLIRRSPVISRIRDMLRVLEAHLEGPVDIELAYDGQDLYLLQCRPQSASAHAVPSPIPADVDPEKVLFTAERHVSNARVPDITHVVYVDPEAYERLGAPEDLEAVGRAVGRLNRILPRRAFALLGPGRWGSRGDMKLGVQVTYSDIHNTALLVEIARAKGAFQPELSFGTHFFQDLAEASIAYLPLYPDDRGVVFNSSFLASAKSVLGELLPDHAHLGDALRVIDVPRETGGRVLRVLMNGDLERAMGLLVDPSLSPEAEPASRASDERDDSEHWQWRLRFAERIAKDLDMERFGVKSVYVFGSTKNATAGPASDIDLLLHVDGDDGRGASLESWLAGWSRCLAELNFMRTGHECDGLLDAHMVTDEDIEKQTSFAAKIGAVTDAARLLRDR